MRQDRFLILAIILLLTVPVHGIAQISAMRQMSQNTSRSGDSDDEEGGGNEEDPCVTPDDQRHCWTQDPITGIHYDQVPDTSYLNLAARQTMEGQSLGLIHTGNLFSPHLVNDFFDRRDSHDFLFINAYSLFAYRPEDLRIYDTKIPYTMAGYNTSGSSNQSNDHLRIDFAGNINKQMGLGTFLDYVYARGEYTSQATKPLKWTSYFYYNADQYKATLSFNISKLANQENGGIEDRSYVLTPDLYDNSFTSGRTMPVNLGDTWNDNSGLNLHFTHSYDLGEWSDERDPKDSTETIEKFTSVASIFHSIDFEKYSHQFRMAENADMTDDQNFYANNWYNASTTLDSTSYASFTTYAGIRVNEGFSKWSQFGLAAFIGYQHQGYTMMQDQDTLSFIDRTHGSNNIFVGGQLSRMNSKYLKFDATAKIGISGDKAGDIDISGRLQTIIPAGREDSIIVQASGYLRNQKVSYLLDHYFSNHFKWSEDFDPERRVHLEGKLRYSLTGTEAKIGIEHISNYHYFSADDYKPHQSSDMIEILSAEFTQNLHWKALHWNNRVLFQTTTHDDQLPLPKIAASSDLSLHFCIANSLTAQLGCTGYYYSKYYAPTYQPATQQFAVQRDIECGGYPLVDAYLNCNLKKIKFFIMYTGIATHAISNDAFLMPYYPLQTSRLQYGVVIDLQN